ncbi:hypothetical protein HDE_04565 [Halotydeus destructor]|nr:hypothetical protein HDE_04565 [Halotydeus destructor]
MHNRVLATVEVRDKTARTTKAEILKVLATYGLSHKPCHYVSDNASAMKKTFEDDSWTGCAAHNLNLVQKHAFERPDDARLEDVRVLLSTCKSIVEFSKRSGVLKDLSKTLKQAVDVRWDSKYTMLLSVYEMKDELLQLAITRPCLMDMIDTLNWDLLKGLIDVLKHLFVWRSRLRDEKKPSFHLIALCEAELKREFKLAWKDHPAIRALKEYLLKYLQSDMSICDMTANTWLIVAQYSPGSPHMTAK